MSVITYKVDPQGRGKGITVYLDGKLVGTIKHVPGPEGNRGIYWQYWPKGALTGGEVFPSVREVKQSLEG